MSPDSSALLIAKPLLAAIPMAPEGIFGFVTNSIIMAIIVTGIILLFTRMATRKMELVPGGKQNLVEFVIEFLFSEVEGIVGRKIALQVFPLLATIFLFILISNWIGLVPGVGTIGFGHTAADVTAPGVLNPDGHFAALFRPATSDLNMTLGLAVVFMIVWLFITIREVGVVSFLKHIFGPKGGMTGFLGLVLSVIFFFVGIIEVVSIVFRPISLSFRLFGNIFAGETLLHMMGDLGKVMGLGEGAAFVSRLILPIPFYFMEILVGLVQAMVFAMLCTVYVQLSTAHDEEDH